MFNRRFAPMLGAASALAALASSVMTASTAPKHPVGFDPASVAHIFRRSSPKGHSWDGKRRKVKRYKIAALHKRRPKHLRQGK